MRVEEVKLERLKIGDLIFIRWLDASGVRGTLHTKEKHFDTPIWVVGIYLGQHGIETKHIVIGKAKETEDPDAWEYDVIPIVLIREVHLLIPRFMQKYLPKGLSKKLTQKIKTIPKIFLNLNPPRWFRLDVRLEHEAAENVD